MDEKKAALREKIRKKLRNIMRPIVKSRIVPFVQQHYPKQCGSGKGEGRRCRVCHSLIRRYVPGERLSHATHYDSHALVTVVVSLSDFGTEYRGGLYLAA